MSCSVYDLTALASLLHLYPPKFQTSFTLLTFGFHIRWSGPSPTLTFVESPLATVCSSSAAHRHIVNTLGGSSPIECRRIATKMVSAAVERCKSCSKLGCPIKELQLCSFSTSSGTMHLHRHRSFPQRCLPRQPCLVLDTSFLPQVDSRVFRRFALLELTPLTIQACLTWSLYLCTMRYHGIIWLPCFPFQV